jgi:hypothetical protein
MMIARAAPVQRRFKMLSRTSSISRKALQKTLGANGSVLEGRPVLQHVDGFELRLEHSGAR